MKLPIKPKAPISPIEPTKIIKQRIKVSLACKIDLQEVLDAIPPDINPKDVKIIRDYDDGGGYCDCSTEYAFEYFKLVSNCNYSNQYKKYLKQLDIYKSNHIKYEKEMEEYFKYKSEYDTNLNQRKVKELLKKIRCAEKELKKLK